MLCAIAIACLFYGCKKDLLNTNSDGIATELSQYNINLSKLKSAYADSIKTASVIKTNEISHSTLAGLIGTTDVDWSTLSIQTFPDNMKVIEFEMPLDTTLITLKAVNVGDTVKVINKTKAVFITHDDTVKRVFYMKVIEEKKTAKSPDVYQNLHYQQIPKDFTGQILYYSPENKFINGFSWKEGQITNTLSESVYNPVTSPQTQGISKKIKPNTVSYVCHTEVVRVLYLFLDLEGFSGDPFYVGWKFDWGTIQVCGWEGSFGPTGLYGPGGVGGGGSGGGGPDPGNPCPGLTVSYVKGIKVNTQEGCPTNPPNNPNPSPYELRKQALINELATNPMFLLPCDEVNKLLQPYQSYGSMFQQVAQFTAPPAVQERIDILHLQSWSSDFIQDNFNIQTLKLATGSVVNSDFFPVRINQMPAGMTAASLTEYFRTHINTFITSGEQFFPYNYGTVNDTDLFNQPGPASIGALVHINLINDGTVVESDYKVTANSAQFKFSTMTSPLDFNHPVSGNREFDVYADPGRPGEFTFYTMGVDRASDIIFAVGNGAVQGFERADNLWTNMQENMIKYIEKEGGHATSYSNPKITARPKWSDVNKYLNGQIDLAELKRQMGC